MTSITERRYRDYIREASEHIQRLFDVEKVMHVTELRVRLDGSIDPKIKYWHWVTFDALTKMYREGKLKRRQRLGVYKLEDETEEGGKRGSKMTFYFPSRYSYSDVKDIVREKLGIINDYSSKSSETGLYAENIVKFALEDSDFEVLGRNTRDFDRKKWKGPHDLDFIVKGTIENRIYGIQVKNTLSYPDWDDVAGLIDICDFFTIKPWFISRQLPGDYITDILNCGGYYTLFFNFIVPDKYEEMAGRMRSKLGLPVEWRERTNLYYFKQKFEEVHGYP